MNDVNDLPKNMKEAVRKGFELWQKHALEYNPYEIPAEPLIVPDGYGAYVDMLHQILILPLPKEENNGSG